MRWSDILQYMTLVAAMLTVEIDCLLPRIVVLRRATTLRALPILHDTTGVHQPSAVPDYCSQREPPSLLRTYTPRLPRRVPTRYSTSLITDSRPTDGMHARAFGADESESPAALSPNLRRACPAFHLSMGTTRQGREAGEPLRLWAALTSFELILVCEIDQHDMVFRLTMHQQQVGRVRR